MFPKLAVDSNIGKEWCAAHRSPTSSLAMELTRPLHITMAGHYVDSAHPPRMSCRAIGTFEDRKTNPSSPPRRTSWARSFWRVEPSPPPPAGSRSSMARRGPARQAHCSQLPDPAIPIRNGYGYPPRSEPAVNRRGGVNERAREFKARNGYPRSQTSRFRSGARSPRFEPRAPARSKSPDFPRKTRRPESELSGPSVYS